MADSATPDDEKYFHGKSCVITVAADTAGALKSDLDYQVLSAEKDLEGNQQQVAFSYDPESLLKLKAGKFNSGSSMGRQRRTSRSKRE